MTVTIPRLEPRHRFYAPAFTIQVSRKNLVRELQLEITSVQVDLMLAAAGRFSFVVNNGFRIGEREFVMIDAQTTLPEFFSLGAEVEIRMGYLDVKDEQTLLSGVITELSLSFPSSGAPQLTVSGFDHSYRMTKGSSSKNWGEEKRDSEVVREIARKYNLEPKVEETKVIHAKIDQSQESMAQFLSRLATRNGFEWFVRGKDLVFRSPANDEKGAVELVWGEGLVSFSPEIRLSEQVTEVEVYGWNVKTKRPIVGRARKGDEPGRDRTRPSGRPRVSGAESLAALCKSDEGKLRVREPVFSQQDADRRARAILKRRAEGFVGGRGESIGIPEIRPNVNVSLRGLGEVFNSTFYVQQATHSIDGSGYRTTFEVKDTTI